MAATAADSWRTWLVTGTRLVPLDLRRARGATGRLKETLIDSPGDAAEGRYRWSNFSSAMDRQAVGEALNALPHQQREVVKLAYFGGMTNREIADILGVTVGGVRHRLQQALATASDYVERGRATGRKLVYVLIACLCGRLFDSTQRTSFAGVEHILRASMVIAAGVTASAVLGLAHSPLQPAPVEPANQLSVKAAIPAAAATLPQTPVVSDAVNKVSGVLTVPVTVSAPSPPINLPIPLSNPTVVSLPIPIAVPIPVPLRIPTPTVPPLP